MSGNRIVILSSGRGSNFSAIADAVNQGKIPNSRIVALVCNIPGAPVIEKAKVFRVPVILIDSPYYFKNQGRNSYDDKLLEVLLDLKPDLICLAGYMLLIRKSTVDVFSRKIINIHPSLLPAFKGLDAQKQALESGVKETGCTVHFVNELLDDGEIILQSRLPIEPNDTVESLSERLLPLEHHTYVEAIIKVLKARHLKLRKSN